MSDRAKDTTDSQERLPSAPDGYLRISDLTAFAKLLIAVVSLLGAFFGASTFFDKFYAYVRVEVKNEQTRAINAENRIENKLDTHLLGRR